MVSDPLLTTLCSVCRAAPPKYKCPRCSILYCSVECNRRHRARAGCNGIRDVTAFVPPTRLRTAAGIDHDYNFLQGIEIARVTAEKRIVDERQLMRPGERAYVLGEEAPPPPSKANRSYNNGKGRPWAQLPALQKEWQDGELHFVPARPRVNPLALADGGSGANGTGGAFETAAGNKVRALCRRDGIELLGVPRGSVRQQENNTTVATMAREASRGRSKLQQPSQGQTQMHLHWQVEWLVYEHGPAAKPTRVLRRLLDHVPLFRAYVSLMAWVLQKQGVKLVDEADIEVEEAAAALSEKQGDMDTRVDGDDNDTAVRPTHKPYPQQNQKPKKHSKKGRPVTPSMADKGSSHHNSFLYAYDFQSSATGAWESRPAEVDAPAEGGFLDDEHLAAKHKVRYFLLRPRLPGVRGGGGGGGGGGGEGPAGTNLPLKELIPLDAADTLAAALPGRSVLEFPTIYVLPAVTGLEEGTAVADLNPTKNESPPTLPPKHILGSTARREIVPEDTAQKPSAGGPRKRQWGHGSSNSRERGDQGSRDGLGADEDDEGTGGDGDNGKPAKGNTRSAKKRKTVQVARIQDLGAGQQEDAEADDEDADMESETSSSGEDSSEDGESEDEDEDEGEGEDEDEEEGELEEEGDPEALPPLKGLGSGAAVANGKPKLVVYDSWSEGSGDE